MKSYLFRKRSRLLAIAICFLPLSLSLSANATSVAGKVTHNMNVPPSANVGQVITQSWGPKPAYSGLFFDFVKTGVRPPGATSYSYTDIMGASGSRSHTLNQAGNWCFRVRG